MTLAGLKEFYPRRRLIVDFMSHTASRTRALLEGFAASFGAADLCLFHRIYPSAREAPDPMMTGEVLFDRAVARGCKAMYYGEPLDAAPFLRNHLQAGDLFITMGAGDNWRLGSMLYEEFSQNPDSKGPQ